MLPSESIREAIYSLGDYAVASQFPTGEARIARIIIAVLGRHETELANLPPRNLPVGYEPGAGSAANQRRVHIADTYERLEAVLESIVDEMIHAEFRWPGTHAP